ncbi:MULTISPECIES: DUF2946 domain-containing protein [Oxalobacteraceae]|jgi:hypothetical protein|uniref:DUF2946 domain-containing protein n=1 Tax=Oxalobacteraceae TaxID=75682 RepID=UPI0010A3C578|nr:MULTISPECIES: DUF2946 domain-containing protein [Oxalobacteraceae]HJV52194.1 DUF2946 domain-containing protein [Noviherbaspirillum sp.]
MNLFTRRLAAWIACFAVLLAALAPSISHAVSAARDGNAGWGDICSQTGFKPAQANNAHEHSSPDPAKPGLHFEHCPFCYTHAGSVGLPPVAGFALPLLIATQAKPSLYYQSPRPLFIWAAAQSRAPPAIA